MGGILKVTLMYFIPKFSTSKAPKIAFTVQKP